ncbi:uncharacterized protein LOC118477442 [Aplysia californica]|uniref:Uncharacterized protein LOC118477442 n=1 Tax=Aplysia californica TaxID=6500 RepID=A0ABM1VQZ8_APLCA|nr:uncharacterized protein LOC118477442 [Aplysia californica]
MDLERSSFHNPFIIMGSTSGGLHWCLCFAAIISGIFGETQIQYVLAFPKHVKHAVASLAISPLSQDFVQNVEVTVTAPARKTSSGEIQTQKYSHNFTSVSNEQWLLNLEHLVHFKKTGIGKKQGIIVNSTSQVVVQARSLKLEIHESTSKSAGAFNVMPVSLLSCEYLVVTESVHLSSFLLVVNSEGFNDVTIEFAFEPAESTITYKKTTIFYSGQYLRESLEPLDVLQILGEGADLTGTWVRAESPVAVIAGANFDCVFIRTVPCNYKDMMIEQLPPVSALGQDYVLAPFRNDDKDSLIKIAYVSPSTTLSGLEHIEMKENTSKNTSTFFSFQLGDTVTYLHATGPILVLQYFMPLLNGTGKSHFDSSCAVLYPIPEWSTHSEIAMFDDTNVHILITALCECIIEINVSVPIGKVYTSSEPLEVLETHRYCSREFFITTITTGNKIKVNGERCSFSGSMFSADNAVLGWAVSLPTYKSSDANTESCERHLTSTEVTTSRDNHTQTLEETSQVPVSKRPGNLCPCTCLLDSKNFQDLLNETVLSSKIAIIQRSLHVPKANLSRKLRSKTSAIDPRPSCTSVGFVVFACTFLPVFGILVFDDFYRIWQFLVHRKTK